MLLLTAPYACGRDGRGWSHILSRARVGPPWTSLCGRQLFVAPAALQDTVRDTARCPDCIVRYHEAVQPRPAHRGRAPKVRYRAWADPIHPQQKE